jgi:hypothetical protein
MLTAVRDVFWGYKSVCDYREKAIREQATHSLPGPRLVPTQRNFEDVDPEA